MDSLSLVIGPDISRMKRYLIDSVKKIAASNDRLGSISRRRERQFAVRYSKVGSMFTSKVGTLLFPNERDGYDAMYVAPYRGGS